MSNTIHHSALTTRIQRLLDGDHRIEDIGKIYLGLRTNNFGRKGFREIGDFIAHPDERERGPIIERMQDMRVAFKPMFDRLFGTENFEASDYTARMQANFNMATDQQIKDITGFRTRKPAQRALAEAITKFTQSYYDLITPKERELLIRLGDSVIWNPALHGQDVFSDFQSVLVQNQLISKADRQKLNHARSAIILHAIDVFHGTQMKVGNDLSAELKAGFNNDDKFLEVTATLTLNTLPKPAAMKVGLLWTDLNAHDHTALALHDHPGPWDSPIEIRDGLISPIAPLDTNASIKTSGELTIHLK